MNMIPIPSSTRSDALFMQLVSRICSSEARLFDAAFIYLVEIDRCFDRKWRAFSGVIDLQLGTWLGPELRVPPFHPNRVVGQLVYRRDASAEISYRETAAKLLHVRQSSYRNIHRLMHRIVPSGLFLWYSGDTLSSDRATILAYRIEATQESSWFASFRKTPEWRIDRTEGISRQELDMLVGTQGSSPASN